MSGVIKHAGKGVIAQKGSILGWVMDHEGLTGASFDSVVSRQNGLIQVRYNPMVEAEQKRPLDLLPPLPDPISFHPELVPYVVDSPSSLVREDFTKAVENEFYAGTAEIAAARGSVTHRIIEHFWRDRVLPDTSQVASALEFEGVDPEAALPMGKDILHEISLCLEEPFFNKLMGTRYTVAYSEWSIEDFTPPDKIRSGTLDFVFRDQSQYFIVDFKTSRPEPEETIDTFLRRQRDIYRPQLIAYREMLSKVKGCSSDKIIIGLYFTCLQRWYQV